MRADPGRRIRYTCDMPMRVFVIRGPTPRRSLLARIALGVLAGLLAVAAFFVGAFLFFILLGVFALAAFTLAVRLWFLRRKLAKARRESGVIEGEYSVLRDRRRD
jgi:hypothetical protein